MKISYQNRNAISIAIGCIVVGIVFLLNSLDIIHLNEIVTHLWALAFVLAGAIILFFSLYDQSFLDKFKSHFAKKMTARYAQGGGESNILGDLEILLTDDTFQSGRYQTLVGKLIIHADKLRDLEEPQYLDLAVAFGEIKMYLPKELPISISTRNIIGTSDVFEQRKDGLHETILYQNDSFKTAQSRIQIICNVFAGTIVVKRI